MKDEGYLILGKTPVNPAAVSGFYHCIMIQL